MFVYGPVYAARQADLLLQERQGWIVSNVRSVGTNQAD